MTALSVNVNKVALLRNSRTHGIPSVSHAARLALEAGANGITVHPRPDGRHILAHDVHELRALLTGYSGAELNIEGNPFHALLDIVRTARPEQCTLVPDDPAARTSDHGWNLARDAARLAPLIREIKAWGARVSLFMDADSEGMSRAADVGADRVELYTEPYAACVGTSSEPAVLARYAAAAEAARRAGLEVNAGHDLNLANLTGFLRAVPGVLEVSIGHALIADALEFGLARTVRLYLEAIAQAGGAAP